MEEAMFRLEITGNHSYNYQPNTKIQPRISELHTPRTG